MEWLMVTQSIVLKKELEGVERLKQLTLLYNFPLNPWIPFIIDNCTITYGRPNATYVLVVPIVLKVYMLQLQCPQLFICVI
jgi:hypothetical protein